MGNISEVAVTTGDDYADALSIGPIAAEKQMPIILVPKDDITSSIQNYISSKTITKTYVVGWQNIISDNVVNKFSNPERITGSDKYLRNITILNRFTDLYQHDKIYLATGENFADALAGAVYTAKNNGAIILVKSNLPDSTNQLLKEYLASSGIVTIFGGEGAIPSSILQYIENPNSNTTGKLDFGTLNGQTYTNKYLGFTITVPSQFTILDNVAGTQKLAVNKNITASADASVYNDVNLLAAEEQSSTIKYTAFVAEADKFESTLPTTDDYLNFLKNGFINNTPLKFTFPKDIYTEKVDGIDFKVLEYSVNINTSNTMYCKTYAILKKGYYLSFTLIYTNNIPSELNQIFSSIQFN